MCCTALTSLLKTVGKGHGIVCVLHLSLMKVRTLYKLQGNGTVCVIHLPLSKASLAMTEKTMAMIPKMMLQHRQLRIDHTRQSLG